jgi:hypothetical protein
MKWMLVIAVLFALGTGLWSLLPLERVYGSGAFSGSQLGNLAWSDQAETLIWYDGGQLQTQAMASSGFGAGWQQAEIPQPDHGYIGFSSSDPPGRVNPVYWDQASAPPVSIYQLVESDPQGDHQFVNNFLDILYYKAAFTGDRLHFAIKNNSNSFPVNSGVTYYSYMAMLVDPDADPDSNPPVYGLMYTVNIPTIIVPGLYKITGTGFADLTQIGDITVEVDPQTDMLLLSCSLADLYADADFSSWFDPSYPLAGIGVNTARTSVTSGTQEADATAGSRVLFKPQPLPAENLQPPVLSNAQAGWIWDGTNSYLFAEIDYSDPDANYPRICSFSLDGGEELPLYHTGDPLALDFSAAQRFAIEPAIVVGVPLEGRFRFSHGDGFVYHTITGFSPNSDPVVPQASVSIYPNPVPGILYLELKDQPVEKRQLRVFNLRGQCLLDQTLLPSSAKPLSLDLSFLSNGMYILELKDDKSTQLKRFIKVE